MEESSGDGAREAGIFYYPHTSAPWGQKLFLALKHHTVQESATLPPREGRHSVTHLWAGAEWRGLGPVPLSRAQSNGVSHGAVALGPVATQVFFPVSWVGSGTDWSCG